MDSNFSNIINIIIDIYHQLSDWMKELSSPIGLISSLITILGGGGLWGLIRHHKKQRKEENEWQKNELLKLGEIVNSSKIELITSEEYIKTMGQNEPPHDGRNVFISKTRFSLENRLLNDLESKDNTFDKKRFIIIGGAGMGKTLFLASLFYQYIKNHKKSQNPSPIYVKSLANPGVINNINKINDVRINDSILLLDALDENFEASKDTEAFMRQIEIAAHEFRIVIITCRTQFFEDAESEPKYWSIYIPGASDNERVIKYRRFYISPLLKTEVDSYLSIKYGSSLINYDKALIIRDKCIDIISRPMILSFIDVFLDFDNVENMTMVDIYYSIIDKWLERDRIINRIEMPRMFSFLGVLAVYMYHNWRNTGKSSLSAKEYKDITQLLGLDMNSFKRSLINRDSEGNIKFSHNSFWEFFLAIDTFVHPQNNYFMNNSLNMANVFHKELFKMYQNDTFLDPVKCFDCHFSLEKGNLSDPLIKKKIEDIQSKVDANLNPDTDPDKVCQVFYMIYELWEMLLQRLRNQYYLIYDHCSKLNQEKSASRQETHRIVEQINKLLDIVQEFFIQLDIEYIKNQLLGNAIHIYNEIFAFNSCHQVELIKERPLDKERLLFTEYITNDIIQDKDSIHLATGLNDYKELFEVIRFIMDSKTHPFLFVYINDPNFEKLISLLEFTDILNDYERRVIFRVYFNGSYLEYFAKNGRMPDNKFSDNEERIIKTIFNMYTIKEGCCPQ